jgi:DNA-binding HxlR family transcriptional regulator
VPQFVYKGKNYNNAVELALDLIGGKWKMPILWRIKDKPQRYSQLKKTLPQTSHKMLAQQLRELENDGFIKRKVYATVPPSVEYSITLKGKGVIPVIETIRNWGNEMKGASTKKIAGEENSG